MIWSIRKTNNHKRVRYYSLCDRILAFFGNTGLIDLWNHANNEFVKHHETTWSITEGFDELTTQYAKNLYFTVLNEIPKEGRIVELGCGGGATMANLVKTKNSSLIVSDISYMAVYKSIDKSKLQGIQMNSESVPFREYSISCVYSTEMLEHIPDPEAVIEEVSRILSKRGKFIFSVPSDGSLTFVEDFVLPILKGFVCRILFMPPPMTTRGHIHIFNEESIRKLAKEYNFKIKQKKVIKAGNGEKISSLPRKLPYDVIRFFELSPAKSPPSVVYIFQKVE